MAMEPLTTKTWSSYDQSSWQSELSKEFTQRNWRETSLEKFIKGTRKITRKSQWQRQQGNSNKHRVRRSTLQNSQKTKDYFSSETRSIFPRTRTYKGEWSHCAIIQRLLDTPDVGKHQSWSLRTTGGLKCLGISDSISAPVTSVRGHLHLHP